MKANVTVALSREDRLCVEIMVYPDKSVSVMTGSRPYGSSKLVMEFAKREQLQDWISMVLDALQDYDTTVAEKHGLVGEA